jgi:LPXTG-site transpeptidase (sortase) family protein
LKAISKVVEEASEDTQHAAAPLDQRPKQLSKWGLHRGYTISIPGIGIRAPVLSPSRQYWDGREWDLLEEQMQVGLTFGAVQYPHSSAPGEDGALIIAGHSSPPSEEAEKSPYGHLFARLPELQFGDTISLLVGGSPVDYEVQEKKIVSPNQTSILAQMEDESTLRLITCYPVGTTKDRLVITAKLVD